MADDLSPAELIFSRWERFLNAQDAAFGGDRELRELSNKIAEIRQSMFADRALSDAELDRLYAALEAAALLCAQWAERKHVPLDGALPASKEAFRVFVENAEIHFQTLAGPNRENFRGGLLRDLLAGGEREQIGVERVVLDLITSATRAIAFDKVHLIRAQLSLLGDGPRQQALLEAIGSSLRREAARTVWQTRREPAITPSQYDEASRFSSAGAIARVPLPQEVRGTNRMFLNTPLPAWEAQVHAAVRSLFDRLSEERLLFVDQLEPQPEPYKIALKVELNMGIDGPPSVSDPAATGAVIRDLLDRAARRGVRLRFTVGDSAGIENAPVGRTSMDILRETGNFHAALKAGLSFLAGRDSASHTRDSATEYLARLSALEERGVFLGGRGDHESSAADIQAIEAAAAECVQCLDYDAAGFTPITPDLGPLGLAIWATGRFHVARPWVEADYRVHVTRGASTHLFAGWTGALKGLIGLHALGVRPADQGMNQRGESPLDLLTGMMHLSGFHGMLARRGGFSSAGPWTSACDDPVCRPMIEQSVTLWRGLSEPGPYQAGWLHWSKNVWVLEAELRAERKRGVPETALMDRMRWSARALIDEADRLSPGFRQAVWDAVADGTRSGLLAAWRMRERLIPPDMRDERMGMRIGLLSRLPCQAGLVVQSLPKIGIGGGPDSYFEVRDAGVVVAGTDEVTVDLLALREAGMEGNPWAWNHPIHGALQFGRGPMSWDEIRVLG